MACLVSRLVSNSQEEGGGGGEEEGGGGGLTWGVTVPLEVLARCEVASFSSAELQLDYYL